MEFAHVSVLPGECMDGLNIKPDGIYVDGTAGGGGHSFEIASRLKTGRLIAIDQDEACLQAWAAKEYKEGETLLGEMWIKDLGCENSPRKAIAFLNRSEKPLTMTASLGEMYLAGDIRSNILLRSEGISDEDLRHVFDRFYKTDGV